MLNIPETQSSPEVLLDDVKNTLSLSGNSYLQDSGKFYKPLLNWGNTFKCAKDKQFSIEIKLGYYSTSSIQLLNHFLKTLSANNPDKIVLKLLIDKEEEDLEETAKALVFNTGITPQVSHY